VACAFLFGEITGRRHALAHTHARGLFKKYYTTQKLYSINLNNNAYEKIFTFDAVSGFDMGLDRSKCATIVAVCRRF
jgi:hypothetical protein